MNNTINSKDSPVFKTDQPHSRYFMKGWLISAGLLSLPVLYDWIFPSTYITDKYYWVVGAMLILRFISEASKDRLMEICFDKEKNQILFTYKGVFWRKSKKHFRWRMPDWKSLKPNPAGHGSGSRSLYIFCRTKQKYSKYAGAKMGLLSIP